MTEKNNEPDKKSIDKYILEKLATDKLFADGATKNSIYSIITLITNIDNLQIEENENYNYDGNYSSYFKLTKNQSDGWASNKYVEVPRVKSCYKSMTYTGSHNSLDLQVSIGKTFRTQYDSNSWQNNYYNKFKIELKKDGKKIYDKSYEYSEGLNTAIVGYEAPWFLYSLYDLAAALPNGQKFERGQIPPKEPLTRRDFDIFLEKDFDALRPYDRIEEVSKEEYRSNIK